MWKSASSGAAMIVATVRNAWLMPNAAVSASSIGHSERAAADPGSGGEGDEEDGAGELMRGRRMRVAERTPACARATVAKAAGARRRAEGAAPVPADRKSTRLNSSHHS